MLNYLRIKNFVIIKDIELEFSKGLNVFTGETGAGKSIIIDAIGLVCGDKVQSDVVGSFGNKCEIEAVIDIGNVHKILKKELEKMFIEVGIEVENEIIIRREISEQNRTKCFVNDKLITLGMLKEISNLLLDIHGQNEHQKLLQQKNQLISLDEYADNESLLEEYWKWYNELRDLRTELEQTLDNLQQKKQHLDLLKYQLEEIRSANLTAEDEHLEEKIKSVKNSQKVVNLIEEIKCLLESDGGIKPKLFYLERQLNNLFEMISSKEKISLDEIYSALESLEQKLDLVKKDVSNFSLEEMDSLIDRVDLIKKLKRKYGSTVEEILSFANKVEEEIKSINYSEEKLEKLNEDIELALENVIVNANKLSDKRKSKVEEFSNRVNKELKFLGLEKAKFEVRIETLPSEEKNLTSFGKDKVEFYIATNPGIPAGPLKNVVSGGELSRIMLALKTVLGVKEYTPIMIFDEIDAGLSGPMGSKVGKKLKEMSEYGKQVFCITHLPQLAAFADRHFVVSKSSTKTKTEVEVSVLSRDSQIKEIARMLSDGEITNSSLEYAKKLIEQVSSK